MNSASAKVTRIDRDAWNRYGLANEYGYLFVIISERPLLSRMLNLGDGRCR